MPSSGPTTTGNRPDVRIVAIANQKGGVGKTTTAANIAAALAEQHRRVLLLDLDPQASLSQYFAAVDDSRALLEAITDSRPLRPLVRDTTTERVQIIPASPWLAGLDKALAGSIGAEMRLRKLLRALPADEWDYLLLDCPPSMGLAFVSALIAADFVLIPASAQLLSVSGLPAILDSVEQVRENFNQSLTVAGILPTRVGHTNHAEYVLSRLRESFDGQVFKATIRESVRVAEAFAFAQPITTYASTSPAADDYRAAARELVRRCK